MTTSNFESVRYWKHRESVRNEWPLEKVLSLLLKRGSLLSMGCWGQIQYWPDMSSYDGRFEVSDDIYLASIFSGLIKWTWRWSHYEGRLTDKGREQAKKLLRNPRR